MNANARILKEEFLKLKIEVANHLGKVRNYKNSHLQNYLYFLHHPLFSFAESVIILCENNKQHVAKVLLRSLVEAHINVIYHQIADSEHRLALSAKAGFDTKLKNIKELQDFIRRYPNLKSENPTNLFNDNWLQSAEQWADKELQGILKGNNLLQKDQELDLKSKAIKCDQENIKNIDRGHFERIYHLIFRQLSPTSHLNVEGIQTFMSQKETGENLFSDGDDGKILIAEAIEICVAFTKDLYECGVITGEVTILIKNIEKLLNKGGESGTSLH